MKTSKITVSDLFAAPRRYLVPIFQRGYVWTKEAQWEPLWGDVSEQAELVRFQQSAEKNTGRKHFLGAIVLSQVPTSIKQVPAFEIIDGQQRLLTLQILLAALRDNIVGIGDEYLTNQLTLMTTNPGPFLSRIEEFKVWPTNAYQGDLASIMGTGSPAILASKYPQKKRYRKLIPPRPALVEAYLYFFEMISGYLKGGTEETGTGIEIGATSVADRASTLYEALIRYVQLVAIELEAEDDPQVIFETLNYRGVPLEPSDLIRNFIFLHADRLGKDLTELYERWWKGFDEASGVNGKFWKEKESQGRMFRSRLDLFFFHYLTYRIGHEIKIGHLYQEFKDWWENSGNPRPLEEELETAVRSSETYRLLSAPNTGGLLGTLADRLKVLDTSTAYPLLLWLCEQRDGIPLEEFDGILTDLESYVIRRAVCKLTPKNYNRVFLSLLTKLSQEGQPSRSSLQRELLCLEGESVMWPSDEAFRRHLLDDPLYLTIGPRRVRMLLVALELACRNPFQEALPLPEHDSLTVEHVMPQSAKSEAWPYPAAIPDETDQVAVKAALDDVNLDALSAAVKVIINRRETSRQIALHSLGNLTLLTQPLNSGVSNGPFRQKRPQIAAQSLLKLNSYFQGFFQRR